jgi:hypothetical protein
MVWCGGELNSSFPSLMTSFHMNGFCRILVERGLGKQCKETEQFTFQCSIASRYNILRCDHNVDGRRESDCTREGGTI